MMACQATGEANRNGKGADGMTASHDDERSVVVFQSGDLFEVEAVAERLTRQGIHCAIEGRAASGVFPGVPRLDQMRVRVLESDEAQARRVVADWVEGRTEEEAEDDL
jgi:hypothetical protein